MADEIYKPDYLKLVPKEPMDYIGSKINRIIEEKIEYDYGIFDGSKIPYDFGVFHEPVIYGHGVHEVPWVVLRFDPFSKDLNLGDKYQTRQESLKNALIYLNQSGFDATVFDLEGLIDNIEVPKE